MRGCSRKLLLIWFDLACVCAEPLRIMYPQTGTKSVVSHSSSYRLHPQCTRRTTPDDVALRRGWMYSRSRSGRLGKNYY